MKPVIHVGIDVGSTTVKVAALSPYLKLLFGRYQRHMSDIRTATIHLLKELQENSRDIVLPHPFPAAAVWDSQNDGSPVLPGNSG